MSEDDPILTFFTDVRDTHLSGFGVKETTYYPHLSNLAEALGKSLKPRVRCIIHPHSLGAGLPDGALITTDQKSAVDDPLSDGLIPARGVMEIKSPGEDAMAVAGSDQVMKYLAKYGLVLVTNLRDFILVGRLHGQPTQLEIVSQFPPQLSRKPANCLQQLHLKGVLWIVPRLSAIRTRS